ARVVHGPAPPHLVGHESPAVPEHATEDVGADPVRRILSPEVVACERPAGVERAVGSQNDLHRVITRLSSVPESCSTPRRSTSLGPAARARARAGTPANARARLSRLVLLHPDHGTWPEDRVRSELDEPIR